MKTQPPKISVAASNHLAFLSFLSTIMVVFIHSTTLRFDDSIALNSTIARIQSHLSLNLFHVALPIFFITSGFFLVHGVSSVRELALRIRARFFSLVIPYLVWSFFWIAVTAALDIGNFSSILDFLETWILRPLPGQFWFLRDLIFLVFLSPIMLVFSRTTLLVIAATTLSWWAYSETNVVLKQREFWFEFISNEAISWFVLGIVFARSPRQFLSFVERDTSTLFISGTLVFWFISPWLYLPGNLPHSMSVISGVLALFSIAWLARPIASSKRVLQLSSYGFVVYVAHHPAITVVKKIQLSILPQHEISHFIVYVSAPLIIMFMILILFNLLFRYFRPAVFFLNGGRELPKLW